MPWAPKRPCNWPGCGALVDSNAYCDSHRKEKSKQRRRFEDKKRPSAAKRGYGRSWQKIRKRKLLENPICQMTDCDRSATEVDHIVPLTRGGGNEPENLQSLCKACHSSKTAKEDSSFARKPHST